MALLTALVGLAAVITGATSVLAWRRRRETPAALPLVGALLAVTVWAVAAVLMNAGLPAAVLDRLVLLQFAGVGATVLTMRLFVDAVTGRPWRRGRALVLGVEPVLVLVAVAVDPWTHWFHATVAHLGDPLVRVTTPGPAFWLHTAYSYAVILWLVADTARLRRTTTGLLRRQAGSMLLAIAAPFVLNLFFVLSPPALAIVDVTPVAFAVTGLLFAFSVLRQDLLRLVPVARSLVVDTITDAVFVVDARDRVVDHNAAATDLLHDLGRPTTQDVGGLGLRELVGSGVADAVGSGEGETVIALGSGSNLDVRTRWIRDGRDRVLGRVVVVRDVTAVLAQQQALELANDQLRSHVATIELLQAELAEEASRDPLTGLRNRRRFVDDLAGRLRTAAATGEPLSLVLLDVDHFKVINDTHGHAVGDDVLIGVAQALREHARAEDVVRYGGEEFVVLLPRLGPAAAAVRAEVLRAACAAVAVEDVRVTISAGVASCPDHGDSPDELLLAADRALYAAKEGGRDRVSVAG